MKITAYPLRAIASLTWWWPDHYVWLECGHLVWGGHGNRQRGDRMRCTSCPPRRDREE